MEANLNCLKLIICVRFVVFFLSYIVLLFILPGLWSCLSLSCQQSAMAPTPRVTDGVCRSPSRGHGLGQPDTLLQQEQRAGVQGGDVLEGGLLRHGPGHRRGETERRGGGGAAVEGRGRCVDVWKPSVK